MSTLEELLTSFRDRENEPDILKANWYTAAAAALAASSAGPDVPTLYRLATGDLPLETQKLVQRRLKEAILKTSILYGGAKAMQAFIPLFKSLKEEEVDGYGPRAATKDNPEADQRRREEGTLFFSNMWTPTAAQTNLSFNAEHYADLELMVLHDTAWYLGETSILNRIETAMCCAAALTCSNSPVQAMWHTRGIVRQGGTKEMAKFAQDLGLAIAGMFDAKEGDVVKVEDIEWEDQSSHA